MNTMMALGAMKMDHNGGTRIRAIQSWFASLKNNHKKTRPVDMSGQRAVAFIAFPR